MTLTTRLLTSWLVPALCFTSACVSDGAGDPADGGMMCPAGWHVAKLYTAPGCDPAPPRETVCSPDIWDASCTVVCGCDGEVYCANTWGTSGDWSYGLPHPFTLDNAELDCVAPATPNTTSDANVDPAVPDSGAATSSERDAATSSEPMTEPEVDASDTNDSVEAADKTLDASSHNDAALDATVAPSNQDGSFTSAADSGDAASADGPDASLGECDLGWTWKQLYTQPGCDSTSRQWVCVPEAWDGGCDLLCDCDGLQHCGEVWGGSGDWSSGLSVPFTTCESDGN